MARHWLVGFLVVGLVSYAGLAGSTVRGMAGGPFTTSIVVNKPIAKTWSAITRKHHVDHYYFAPLGHDITTAGEKIYYGTAEQKLIVGEVVTFEPSQTLAHTFRFVGGDRQRSSLAIYRLEQRGEKTVVQISHGGFAIDSQDYANIAMGWPIILDRLKAHLEQ